jgi:hypothetical protein
MTVIFVLILQDLIYKVHILLFPEARLKMRKKSESIKVIKCDTPTWFFHFLQSTIL